MHSESLSNLAKWGGLDKGDLSRAFAESGIKPEVKGRAHLFPIDKAIGVIVALKTNAIKGSNSADRRNNAQAEKLELEAAILRRDFVPVEKGVAIWARFLSTLAEIVQSSELPNDARERFVDRVHDQIGRLADDLRGEQSEPDSDD